MSDRELWSRIALGQYVSNGEMLVWLTNEGFDEATLQELLLRLKQRGVVECYSYPGVTHYPDWRLTVPTAVALHYAKAVDAEIRLEHWSGE